QRIATGHDSAGSAAPRSARPAPRAAPRSRPEASSVIAAGRRSPPPRRSRRRLRASRHPKATRRSTSPRRPSPPESRGKASEALAVAQSLGMRPAVGPTATSVSANSTEARGDVDRERENLGAALSMYRDMGMPHWVEQAEEALREMR